MTISNVEGFDAYGTNAAVANELLIANGYTIVAGSPTIGNTNPSPRTGVGRLKCTSYDTIKLPPFTPTQTIYCGIGMHIAGTPTLLTNGSGLQPISFGNGTTGTYGEQVWFTFDSGGYLKAYQWESNLLGTSDIPITLNDYVYVEIYVKASNYTNSLGEIIVKFNGTIVLTLTGIITITYGAEEYYTYLVLSSTWNGVTVGYDDIYVDNSGFKGICQVNKVEINGAGASTMFTPTLATNWQSVAGLNSTSLGTDFVYGSSINDLDLYTKETLTDVGTIKGVQFNIISKKTSGTDNKTIESIVRSNDINYSGSSLELTLDNWKALKHIAEVDPNTSTVWTKNGFDSAQIGQKITV